MFDLRSDTVTVPGFGIRQAMFEAQVGDDCFGDDPSVSDLEKYCQTFFEKEATLFTCGGTMSNQIAMLATTQPGDEIILDASYHINYFESAATARFSGVSLNLIRSMSGVYDVEDIKNILNTKARWSASYSLPKVIVIENTVGCHGGTVFPLENMKRIYKFAHEHGIFVYLDGARILNATAKTGIPVHEYAKYCDGMSMCFSKGLSAPMGAIMAGTRQFIANSKKFRKWIGGDMHQSGIIAAGALYSIKNYGQCFELDHKNALSLWGLLSTLPTLTLSDVHTNMIYIDLTNQWFTSEHLCSELAKRGLKLIAWNSKTVRIVTHQNITNENIYDIFLIFKTTWSELTAVKNRGIIHAL